MASRKYGKRSKGAVKVNDVEVMAVATVAILLCVLAAYVRTNKTNKKNPLESDYSYHRRKQSERRASKKKMLLDAYLIR